LIKDTGFGNLIITLSSTQELFMAMKQGHSGIAAAEAPAPVQDLNAGIIQHTPQAQAEYGAESRRIGGEVRDAIAAEQEKATGVLTKGAIIGHRTEAPAARVLEFPSGRLVVEAAVTDAVNRNASTVAAETARQNNEPEGAAKEARAKQLANLAVDQADLADNRTAIDATNKREEELQAEQGTNNHGVFLGSRDTVNGQAGGAKGRDVVADVIAQIARDQREVRGYLGRIIATADVETLLRQEGAEWNAKAGDPEAKLDTGFKPLSEYRGENTRVLSPAEGVAADLRTNIRDGVVTFDGVRFQVEFIPEEAKYVVRALVREGVGKLAQAGEDTSRMVTNPQIRPEDQDLIDLMRETYTPVASLTDRLNARRVAQAA
jgi:hypothetical protein